MGTFTTGTACRGEAKCLYYIPAWASHDAFAVEVCAELGADFAFWSVLEVDVVGDTSSQREERSRLLTTLPLG